MKCDIKTVHSIPFSKCTFSCNVGQAEYRHSVTKTLTKRKVKVGNKRKHANICYSIAFTFKVLQSQWTNVRNKHLASFNWLREQDRGVYKTTPDRDQIQHVGGWLGLQAIYYSRRRRSTAYWSKSKADLCAMRRSWRSTWIDGTGVWPCYQRENENGSECII